MANPRYRRSRSAGPIVIDHQPKNPVDTNTIMQPTNLKKKRSVTKLDKKDLEDPKCSNYALTTQEQDSEGDVETKIFKVCNPPFSNSKIRKKMKKIVKSIFTKKCKNLTRQPTVCRKVF